MAVSIPFNSIAPSTLVPGVYLEIHALDNTGLQQFHTLLIGQVTSGGSLGPVTINTSAATASGSTLTFTSVPATVVAGMLVEDLTTSGRIAAGTTVLSTTGTTVVLSAAVIGGGVLITDHIRFSRAAIPALVTNANDAAALYGQGSMLANMIQEYRQIDTFGTVYALPLTDDAAAVAATGQITITGTATAPGVLSLYVAGQYIPVIVTTSMLNSDIAVAVTGAINATPNLPVTASGATFPVTLTANNAGICGNDIDVRVNYRGARNNESTPAGLMFNFTGMASGAVNPSLTTPLANLASLPFDVIAAPYSDSGSLSAMATFLNDSAGRWAPLSGQLFGHYFTVATGTVGSVGTLALNLNSQHVTVVASIKSPSPPYQVAAAIGAQASVSLSVDPGLPLNNLELVNCLPPAIGDQLSLSQQQTLLANGAGTLRVAPGNLYVIQRLVTTYSLNSFGFADNSYQNVEKLFCISYSAKYTGSILSSNYSRVKLAADGVRVPIGSNIVTPSVVKGSLIDIYGDLCDQGVMDGSTFDNFAKNVQVQINGVNRNMLDILMPITPIHQLDTLRVAVQIVLG